MKLELFFYTQCPFCFKVLKKIEKFGLEGKIELKNVLENPDFAEYHSNKTGRNTVPCLYIDDDPMFESNDIISWLKTNKDAL